MLFDIKDNLIREIYLPHLQYMKDTYMTETRNFFNGVDIKCQPYKEMLERRVQEHIDDKDYCVCFEMESQIIPIMKI